jgi:hypothetical protein
VAPLSGVAAALLGPAEDAGVAAPGLGVAAALLSLAAGAAGLGVGEGGRAQVVRLLLWSM